MSSGCKILRNLNFMSCRWHLEINIQKNWFESMPQPHSRGFWGQKFKTQNSRCHLYVQNLFKKSKSKFEYDMYMTTNCKKSFKNRSRCHLDVMICCKISGHSARLWSFLLFLLFLKNLNFRMSCSCLKKCLKACHSGQGLVTKWHASNAFGRLWPKAKALGYFYIF